MRNFKKILALLLSITMVLGLGVAAFAAYKPAGNTFDPSKDYYTRNGETYSLVEEPVADEIADYFVKTVSISVSQDSTFAGEDGEDSRVLTYNWIFRATKTGDSKETEGGYDSSTGDPLAPTVVPSTGVGYSYFLLATDDAARITQLGTWHPAVEATYEDDTTKPIADANGVAPDGEGWIPTYEQKIKTEAVAAYWEKATGNEWFKLTPSADGSRYTVEWDATKTVDGETVPDTDQETVQAAAQWLAGKTGDTANYTPITTATLEWDSENEKWAANDLNEGYYLIESVAGNNLIAATTDIEVKEKNDYPPVDKTQADTEDATQSGADRDVKVGDTLTYEVKVTIPKTAKVGDKIVVWDKATNGLVYQNDVAVKEGGNTGNATVEPAGSTNYTGTGAVAGADWNKLITVTAGSQGKDVIFTFTMKVTDDALVDTGKKNESGLKYGNGNGDNPFPYESKPDEVKYKTYYAGIHKIDPDAASEEEDLEGVEFTLKENGNPCYVKLVEVKVKDEETNEETVADTYYIPCLSTDTGATTTIVTDAQGLIHIRGLDEDKVYTVTETKTLDGYNLLDHDVTLTLHEDTTKTVTYTVAEEWNSNTKYYTRTGTSTILYTEVTVDEATFSDAQIGTYYTKDETGTESYTSATDKEWEDEIENKTGTILPSTGGIGTTIFYIVGGLLAVGAGVVLVSKKRMGKVDD